MDPTTTLNLVLAHLRLAGTRGPHTPEDWYRDGAIAHLEDMTEWLRSGGFVPYVGGEGGTDVFYVPSQTPKEDR